MLPVKMTTYTLAAAFAVSLAGCASTPPPNPELARLEAQLKADYSDKYIAQYGQADLYKAEAALTGARKAIHDRKDDEAQHNLNMAQGYINLGETHGNQERTKAEIVTLNMRQNKIRLEARDRQIALADDKTAAAQADAASANAAKDAAVANAQQSQMEAQSAEQKAADMKNKLSMYHMKMTALGATLVLRDVMFATDSSVLREGAVNRLNPLIEYLRANPNITVRIEGHTDNVGSSAHNQVLSLARANSVADALRANGGINNPIQTIGMGESAPIASNKTVSGREQNRRVEVTLAQQGEGAQAPQGEGAQ